MSFAAFARMTQRRQEMVRVYAVDGVAATLDVPTFGDIPKHADDQPLDKNVLALACLWIPVVKPRIAPFVDVSSPDPAWEKCTSIHVRFHEHQPLAWNIVQGL